MKILRTAENPALINRAQGALARLDQIIDLASEIREYQKQIRTTAPGLGGLSVAKKVGA